MNCLNLICLIYFLFFPVNQTIKDVIRPIPRGNHAIEGPTAQIPDPHPDQGIEHPTVQLLDPQLNHED